MRAHRIAGLLRRVDALLARVVRARQEMENAKAASGRVAVILRPDRNGSADEHEGDGRAVLRQRAHRAAAHRPRHDARRTVGADGKTYPGSHEAYRHGRRPTRQWTPLVTDLGIARTAVRRLARATKFTDEDLAELRTIAGEAGELLRRWTIAVEAHEH